MACGTRSLLGSPRTECKASSAVYEASWGIRYDFEVASVVGTTVVAAAVESWVKSRYLARAKLVNTRVCHDLTTNARRSSPISPCLRSWTDWASMCLIASFHSTGVVGVCLVGLVLHGDMLGACLS